MALIDNLISYWSFDEASGDAADSSGNSKTLTNTNSIPYVSGKINNGADLEFASQQYFTRSNGTYYDVTSGTINLWIKPETIDVTPGNISLVSTGTNAGAGGFDFELKPHNSDVVGFSIGAGANGVLGGTSLTPGVLYMVTATWSPLRKEVFVNATSDGANETDETLTAGAANLYVGRYAGTNTLWYDGILDELGIWNRVLSGAEITSLYNGGAGFPYPFVPFSTAANPLQTRQAVKRASFF